jgi:hypothetical protein
LTLSLSFGEKLLFRYHNDNKAFELDLIRSVLLDKKNIIKNWGRISKQIVNNRKENNEDMPIDQILFCLLKIVF